MKLTILIVDDETPIREWMVFCARSCSDEYKVHSATCGEDALKIIEEIKPDIILTDIRMPGMDGLTLMRKAIQVCPFVSFAILSNYADFSYAKEAISLGAKEYLLKSEMRANDLKTLLSSAEESKAKKINSKKNDIYSSGCIDLYNFLNNKGDMKFVDSYWKNLGMDEDCEYVTVCIKSSSSRSDWVEAAEMTADLMKSRRDVVYSAVACEKGRDYIIIQTRKNLDALARDVCNELKYRGVAAISQKYRNRKDISVAFEESYTALRYSFFQPDKSVIKYEELISFAKLDRYSLQEEKNEIDLLMSKNAFNEAIESLNQLILQLSNPHADDVMWATDFCRRLLFSIEEKYYSDKEIVSREIYIPKTIDECRDKCTQMLDELCKEYHSEYSDTIKRVIIYIETHYNQDISLSSVAEHVFRSPEYISRLFKTEVGETFSSYLSAYRIEKARQLLTETDFPISDIAEKVGLTSASYFSRTYKKYKGHTPEQERTIAHSQKK